jgi:hypothetical protein
MWSTAGTAAAGSAVPFAVALHGEPQIDCLVLTDPKACGGARLAGTAASEGTSGFGGSFAFDLAGGRRGRQEPRRLSGPGRLVGSFTFIPSDPGRRCVVVGRVSARMMDMPASDGRSRFLTGTFGGRGSCDGVRVAVRAIWSGAVAAGTADLKFDFERFDGHLAGTIAFSNAGRRAPRGVP